MSMAYQLVSCSAALASSKALKSHMRVKHGVLSPQRLFAGSDGKCASCSTAVGSRLRLLAHLSDTRRTACWTHVHLLRPMRVSACAVLDAADTMSRRRAWKIGHSHAIAHGAAIRSNGRPKGRASL